MENKLDRSIGRLEGKVDSLISDIKYIRENSEVKMKGLEKRVGNLEKKQFTMLIIATILWTGLLVYIKKFI